MVHSNFELCKEVGDVETLAEQEFFNISVCGNGLFGINASTNVGPFRDFEFADGITPNTSSSSGMSGDITYYPIHSKKWENE